MANIQSAKKRARQAVRRTEQNVTWRSRLKTAVRKVEDSLKAGDKKAAVEAFKVAEPTLRKGVQKGVVHLKTVSRKISRLSQRVKALS